MSKQKKPYKTLRNFIISIILLILLACLLPFFLKGPGDQKLLSTDKIKLPEIKFLKKKPQDTRVIPTTTGDKRTKNSKTIFKWKDKDGVLHFTDYPNPNGPSQEMEAPPHRTSADEFTPSKKQFSDIKKNEFQEAAPALPLPMTISPSQVKKLKEDAEKIGEVLKKRYDNIAQTQE